MNKSKENYSFNNEEENAGMIVEEINPEELFCDSPMDDGWSPGIESDEVKESIYFPKSFDEYPRIVNSIEDLNKIELFCAAFRMCGFQFLFRGHAKEDFILSPTIVRNKVKDYGQEKAILEKWKIICQSNGYDKFKLDSFNDNLFYMSLGRHLGLFSRLLDWTAGLWDALSFLMEDKDDNREHDGILWILVCPKKDLNPKNGDPFLFEDDKVHLLREDYYFPNAKEDIPLGILRRRLQNGYFSVVSEDLLDASFEEIAKSTGYELLKITIPKETKALLEGNQRIPPIDWLYGKADEEEPIIKEVELLNQQFKVKD